MYDALCSAESFWQVDLVKGHWLQILDRIPVDITRCNRYNIVEYWEMTDREGRLGKKQIVERGEERRTGMMMKKENTIIEG